MTGPRSSLHFGHFTLVMSRKRLIDITLRYFLRDIAHLLNEFYDTSTLQFEQSALCKSTLLYDILRYSVAICWTKKCGECRLPYFFHRFVLTPYRNIRHIAQEIQLFVKSYHVYTHYTPDDALRCFIIHGYPKVQRCAYVTSLFSRSHLSIRLHF